MKNPISANPQKIEVHRKEVDLTGCVARKELMQAYRKAKDSFSEMLFTAYEEKRLSFDPKGIQTFIPKQVHEIIKAFGHPYAVDKLR
tara:strand:- start:221 stop:481 length:261 start_codon:yes stop_codon:yes gene_type:complete